MKKLDLITNKDLIDKLPKATYEYVFYEACLNNLDQSQIYVDNIANPKSALFLFKGREGALFGNIDEDILIQVEKIISNVNPEVFFLPKINEKIIYKIFGEVDILNRNFYLFKDHKDLHKKHKVLKYNEVSSRRIAKEIDDDFDYAWDTPQEFVNHGAFGFYIEENNEIISTAWSFFPSDKNQEIAVITRKEYRNRGLGVEVCSMFIDETIKAGKIPHWSCNKDNLPSNNLAKKLGFEFDKEYYWVFF